MTFQAWHGQPWRLFSSALPHVNLIHLAFNVYWLWVFGTLVEDTFGWWKTLLIFLLFEAGSTLAEFAFFAGGVGLSGIGYGLFGLLWILSRKDSRFAKAVDAQTVFLFIAWFFLCCALTATKVWQVGNAAHAMGFVFGIVLGFTITAHHQWRAVGASLLVVTMAVMLLSATLLRPWVNFAGQVAHELAYNGYLDIKEGRYDEAVTKFQEALRLNNGIADWWTNLGCAYQYLDRAPEAIEAHQHALDLDPSKEDVRQRLASAKAQLAYLKQINGEHEAAIQLYQEALVMYEANALFWYNLGTAFQAVGKIKLARDAYMRASRLEPENQQYRESFESLNQVAADP
jgi:membrane associated rhomboid family serine protease